MNDPTGRPWHGACTLCDFRVAAATEAEARVAVAAHIAADHVLADVWHACPGE